MKNKKKCKYCNKYYHEKDFGIASTIKNKVYRRNKCRFCYRKTKENLRQKYRLWINKYKKKEKCCKCGVSDYRVLEFHHKNKKEKEFSIGEVVTNGYGFLKIEKELKKCLVVCANCHRKIHYKYNKLVD